MSVYQVQKLMRDVNRLPDRRAAWLADRAAVVAGYVLSDAERRAVLACDYGTLYRMGAPPGARVAASSSTGAPREFF